MTNTLTTSTTTTTTTVTTMLGPHTPITSTNPQAAQHMAATEAAMARDVTRLEPLVCFYFIFSLCLYFFIGPLNMSRQQRRQHQQPETLRRSLTRQPHTNTPPSLQLNPRPPQCVKMQHRSSGGSKGLRRVASRALGKFFFFFFYLTNIYFRSTYEWRRQEQQGRNIRGGARDTTVTVAS